MYPNSIEKPPGFGVRYTQIILCFFLLAIGYASRVTLSVGIVAMTDSSTSPNPDIPTYNWTDKSLVLSSFFWGYVLVQVLAGICAKRYGPKWFLVGSMAVNSILCLLIPIVADYYGSKGVMMCRVAQGLSQSFFYPSCQNLMGKWAPPTERSRMATIVFSGSAFGTIVSMPLTGLISASWYGWPLAFYIHGLFGVFWVIIWAIFGANSPADHRNITTDERLYIEKELGRLERKKLPIPWRSIVTSLPFWAILVALSGHNWGFTMLFTEIPNYMNKIMKFDMNYNGLISAAPYLAMWLMSYGFGFLSDFLINRQYFSRVVVRKFHNTLGVATPAIALIGINYIPEEQRALTIIIFVIAVGINSAIYVGFQVNHVDISPNYAGVLMGITNGTANIFSILGPLTVHLIVTDEYDRSQWKIAFYISSIIYIISAIFYLIFAKGDVQKWNDPK